MLAGAKMLSDLKHYTQYNMVFFNITGQYLPITI